MDVLKPHLRIAIETLLKQRSLVLAWSVPSQRALAIIDLCLFPRVEKIGPNTARFARELFAKLGRPGQRAIYGLANLPRGYACADIDAVCATRGAVRILCQRQTRA